VYKLTVVIVSYNTRELLLQCLESLFKGTEGIATEVFVVDNASKDESAEAVEKTFPQVHLIRNPENHGFARAVNQGLKRSRGEYLLLLNPDTTIPQDTLPEMLSFLEDHPNAGAAGPQLLHEDGRLQNSFANFPTLATELLNKSLLRTLFPGRYPGKNRKFSGPVEVESVIGACMLVKREAFHSVGMLDEGYFFFLEETDWCLRMRKSGWKIFFLPHLRVLHLQGRSAGETPLPARIEYYRSRYRFFTVHRPKVSGMILRAGLFIRLVLESLASLLISLSSLFLYRKEVRRLRTRVGLLVWHLAGCPDNQGLKRLYS